jgi:5'-3' exonuclease
MTYPNHAILDGDIIAYRLAHRFEPVGIDNEDFEQAAEVQVADWIPQGIDKFEIAFSCSRRDNFRKDYLPDYKEHRTSLATPTYLKDIISYLKATYPSVVATRLEADDIMGLSQHKAVTVTIDKDLLSVPGWIWNPDKDGFRGPWLVSEVRALGTLCLQWIMGDRTDNIPGIKGLGPKKAWDILTQSGHPVNWPYAVLATYESKGYTPEDALATFRGVYILRDNELKYPL